MNNWISVTDKLPDVNKGDWGNSSLECLVLMKDGEMAVAYLIGRWKEWHLGCGHSCGCSGAYDECGLSDAVTHWMELPEPPDE